MKRLLFLIVLFSGLIFGRNILNKDQFDLGVLALSKSAGVYDYQLLDNENYEVSLAYSGFFTIGTKNGNGLTQVDDNCTITFGHPYAKTSFPLVSIDGNWENINDYFSNTFVEKNSGHLIMNGIKENELEYKLDISINDDNEILITSKIINTDNQSHNLASVIVFDPGMGKGGDGSMMINGEFGLEKIKLENIAEIDLWEKYSGAKGIGITISSDENFDKVLADNWHFSHDQNSPELSDTEFTKLYDLLMRFYWDEKEVASGDSIVNTMTISFPEPDFSTELFTRWDLPNFFDLLNGALFPRTQSTYLEISKTENSSPNSATIEFEMPDQIETYGGVYTINLGSKNTEFQKVQVNSDIVYEDMVVEVTSKLISGGETIDELSRYVFLPETPVSDSGLTVYDDSLITSSFPEVGLVFNVENNILGRKITDLTKENIFLYENETRINDFELGFYEANALNTADIVFVLDVTGSMSDEIAGVKNNIVEFADELEQKGINYQLGMVTFLDDVENIYGFTNNVNEFKDNVSKQYAHGGGNYPENSIDALVAATEFEFRPQSKATIVWITDASFYNTDYTKEDVVDLCLAKSITVHCIGNTGEQTEYYNPIVNPTGGNFYNIRNDFRTILLDIANMGGEYKYQITYNTLYPDNSSNDIYLKLRYNGLGTQSIFTYDVPQSDGLSKEVMTFYPNPFNERINFVLNLQNLSKTKMYIYNILGKKIMEYTLPVTQGYHKIAWNGKDLSGRDVSTGMYIIQLAGISENGEKFMRTNKILYLK